MNNSAAIGYMILAAKELGFPAQQIKELMSEMEFQMDICQEEEAEEAFQEA